MPKFTGKFEYLVDGKKVTQEQFQQLVDGREENYNISIDNLRVVASGKGYKSEPFFLDEFLFPAKNYEEVKIYDIKIPVYGSISSTGGTVFEKVQDSTLPPHPTVDEIAKIFSEGLEKNIKHLIGLESNYSFTKAFNLAQERLLENSIRVTDVDPVGVYNDIVGHSTRHKADKESAKKIQECLLTPEEFFVGKREVDGKIGWQKAQSLENIKKNILNSTLFLSLEDVTLVNTAETKEQLKPLIERMENCKGVDENFGKKEVEGKLDYSEINFELLDLMAKRFMDNKVKYPKGNTLKQINKEDLVFAAFRHLRKMIKPVKDDPETFKDHLVAVSTNMSILLDQLNLEDDKTN